MNQTVRTMIFLGVAVVCVGIGYATHSKYKPSDLEAFIDVGEPFYPNFTDPNAATGIRVASYNEESGKTDVFSVENENGLWKIPSHHEYPADGEDRLAQTAASIIGVERQALIEQTKAAHKRYGLLDPLDDSVIGSEGRGDRITLYDGDDVLVDFIVGNKVEGQQSSYYVRAADEDRFYSADLGELDISTKFTDWINKDILDIDRTAVREMIVNRYRIDEARGVLIQGDRLTLSRPDSSGPWKLEGLDESKEELETTNVTNLLAALDDLSIVGVRNKPTGISAGLKGDASQGMSTSRFDMLDLQEKGFFIDPREGGGILSNEGEVLVGTDDGVLYVLRFGEEFSGSEVDIEVGSDPKKDEKVTEEKTDESEPKEEDADEDSLVKSRYLFVTAQFDRSNLGEKPTPPVKPEPPKEEAPAEPDTGTDTDADTDADADADAEKKADAPTAEEKKDEKKPVEPEVKPNLKKQYEEALQKYNEEQEVYEIKLRNYEQKVAKGKERVNELNRRFADWYYVISAEVFDRMKINRDELVKAKEAPAEEAAPPAGIPGLPGTATPKPKMKAPAANTPPAKETPAEPKKPEVKPEATPKETPAKPAPKPEPKESKKAEKKPAKKKPEVKGNPAEAAKKEAPAKPAEEPKKSPAPAEKKPEPATEKLEE